ncbi:pentapeptide repeat-containing protein [Desulfosporosinus sp. I2]|uniref:pentapeptide repeat-containing protein n=1 Tax=Desulfosporosinus sp. I2 TaxID=1617025 RepID=UPI0009E36D8E|nr:pentapeptide repeat-containing protein [Desulfosporosinus sp. I2]
MLNFNHTDFSYSDLSDVCFDNQTLVGTIFNCSELTGTSFKNIVFRINHCRRHMDIFFMIAITFTLQGIRF